MAITANVDLGSGVTASSCYLIVPQAYVKKFRPEKDGEDATYKLRVENPDGLSVLSSSALLTVSDAPTWSTSAGSLGEVAAGSTVSLDVDASSDSTVAFSETTSVLTSNSNTPASTMNLTLNSSTGAITGTAPAATAETTYNFTLRATDAESQTADRAFSIKVTVGMNNSAGFTN